MSIKSTLIDFLLQNLMLRSLCAHAQKQLFLSILVNSGRIFWHYSPRVQRIIITYATLILLHFTPALRGATWFLIISLTSREKTPEVSDQKTKTISTKPWLPLFFPTFIFVGNYVLQRSSPVSGLSGGFHFEFWDASNDDHFVLSCSSKRFAW